MSPPSCCSLICQDSVPCLKSSLAFCRGHEQCGDCRRTFLKQLIDAALVLVLSEVLWQQHRFVQVEYLSVTKQGVVFFRGLGVRIQLCNSGQRIIHTHKSLSDAFC